MNGGGSPAPATPAAYGKPPAIAPALRCRRKGRGERCPAGPRAPRRAYLSATALPANENITLPRVVAP